MSDQVNDKISIAIVMATPVEAEPFIRGLDMEDMASGPFAVYLGQDAVLVVSGIGKVNAAMACEYACMRFDPSCILNLGAAGSVHDSEELGSVYNIQKVIEPDRIHLRTNSPFVQYPDDMEVCDRAVLATQDRAIIDVNMFREISAYADLVDMEGASVLQASRRFGKRCLLFKFVTDTPAHAGQGRVIMENVMNLRGPFRDFIIDSVIPSVRDTVS